MNRRSLLLLGVTLPCSIGMPKVASAIICENCATVVQQLLDAAKQAQQYFTQLQSLQQEVLMYANMVRNSLVLPMQMFSQLQGTVGQLVGLTNVTSLLGGQSGSMLTRLTSAGGYGGSFLSDIYTVENVGNQLDTWQQTLGGGLKRLASALGLQQSDLQNSAALTESYRTNLSTAGGQMQAIQALGDLTTANGDVLHQIAQTNIAYAQAWTAQQTTDNDRRAAEDAAMLHFSQFNPPADTGNQGW